MNRRLAVRQRCRGEGGFTLTEALAALIILGVAVFGILTAMGASAVTSDVHRKSVTSDAIVKSWAERLNSVVYQECATAAVPQYQPAAMAVTVPTGFTASITSIRYWNGDGGTNTPATFSASCPGAPDNGVQQITLLVKSSDNRGKQQVTILKRRL
jgi:Tfp pilus assembly protein PilV